MECVQQKADRHEYKILNQYVCVIMNECMNIRVLWKKNLILALFSSYYYIIRKYV